MFQGQVCCHPSSSYALAWTSNAFLITGCDKCVFYLCFRVRFAGTPALPMPSHGPATPLWLLDVINVCLRTVKMDVSCSSLITAEKMMNMNSPQLYAVPVVSRWSLEVLIGKYDILLGQKINYMFLRHRPHHLQPPASNIFIAFPVFTLKNCLYITNCQFRSAVICRHFVCLLAGAHTKSR